MIYVDSYFSPFKGKEYCHMFSDESLDELHEFAGRIGVKRCWFHVSNDGTPHYDILANVRLYALQHGALIADIKKVSEIIRLWREKKEGRKQLELL